MRIGWRKNVLSRGNAAILSFVCLVIAFMVIMNASLLSYREDEIAFHLNVISREMSDYRSMGLVGRYILIKRRLAAGQEQGGDLLEEARLQSMLTGVSSGASPDDGSLIRSKALYAIISRYVAVISVLQGKRAPQALYEEYNDPVLELAYYFERNRKWERAIRLMEKILAGDESSRGPSFRFALLHTGFCYAMLSRYDSAFDAYERLLREFPDYPEAETAKKLLSYLLAVEKGVRAVLSSGDTSDVKGLRLYLLSSYSHALRELDSFIRSTPSSHPSFYSSLYYRGRSYEELGHAGKAAEDYSRVVTGHSSTAWAVKANRRLFIMGTSYGGDRQLAQQAEARSVEYGDVHLIDSLKTIRTMTYAETLTPESAEAAFSGMAGGKAPMELPPPGRDNAGGMLRPEAARTSPDTGPAGDFAAIVERSVGGWTGAEQARRPIYARIETSTGFRLRGMIVREDDRQIVLRTEFGTVPVPVSTIRSITRTGK